jgi:hypothetical protein
VSDRHDGHTAELHAGGSDVSYGHDRHSAELHTGGDGMSGQFHRQAAELRMQCRLLRPELCA